MAPNAPVAAPAVTTLAQRSWPYPLDPGAVDQEALAGLDHRAGDPCGFGSAAEAPNGHLLSVAENGCVLTDVAEATRRRARAAADPLRVSNARAPASPAQMVNSPGAVGKQPNPRGANNLGSRALARRADRRSDAVPEVDRLRNRSLNQGRQRQPDRQRHCEHESL